MSVRRRRELRVNGTSRGYRRLPGAGGREGEGGEAGGFGGGDAEQAQDSLGELVDGGLGDAVGVLLVQPQEPERILETGTQPYRLRTSKTTSRSRKPT